METVEVDLATGVETRRQLSAKEAADLQKIQAASRAETERILNAPTLEQRLAAVESKVK